MNDKQGQVNQTNGFLAFMGVREFVQQVVAQIDRLGAFQQSDHSGPEHLLTVKAFYSHHF
ncbi:MAG: hypothetical protein WA902_18630 [Thermosynechococcaceae cyanobacterium]